MSDIVIIRIFKDGKAIEVRQFEKEQIVFGKNPETDFCLNRESIAPIHFSIEKRDEGYFISDLGSSFGTYINSEKVIDQAIASGERIQISDIEIEFNVGGLAPRVNLPNKVENEEPSIPAIEPDGNVSATQVDAPVEPAPVPLKKSVSPKKPSVKSSGPSSIQPLENLSHEAIQGGAERSKKGTYAPLSFFTDPLEYIKPGKGSAVEVTVTWRERALNAYSFQDPGVIYVGSSESCQVQIPLLAGDQVKRKLFKMDGVAQVFISPSMTGVYYTAGGGEQSFAELFKQQGLMSHGKDQSIKLAQGDMLRIDLQGGLVSIYIRYAASSPRPVMAPLLDLTATEVTAFILAIVVASLFGLYLMVYSPSPLDNEATQIEEPFRRAIIKFTPPPKMIVKVDKETQKKVVTVDATKEKVKKQSPASAFKKGKQGKAANLAAAHSKKTKILSTTRKKGGAIKTGKSGSNMNSEKRDIKKEGLLSVFGSRGAQKKLSKVYSGAGELQGIAGSSTGYSGQASDRAGEGIGSRLKNLGAGGSGAATVGISGVGTKGRGSGAYGLGEGGIGKKGNFQINVAGQEAAFEGSIDRDAIRRVILDNVRQIRACYERELNKNADLFGKLVLEWDIIEKGKAIRPRVKSNGLNSAVANCVMKRLVTWRFPEPPEDQIARVTYPFVFSSK